MDGLSAAASGIAVISLAIQLVDSVREIRRFCRTLKDTPEELGRLLDLLEQMELMLSNIGKLVDPDSDISPSVLKSMHACEKALHKLGTLIQKVKSCKKQEVEEIEKQLDRAVNNLNMVMTTLNLHGIQRLWRGVSAANAAAATITDVVLRMEVAANQGISKQKLAVDNWSRDLRSTVCRRSATHRIVYQGFLGSLTVRIHSQSEDSVEGEYAENLYARDEWSWVFIPSFLSNCVQIKCVSSFGLVERALRTYSILPDDHPAWRMAQDGDVNSIQELFSTRKTSPYAINRTGETLLHRAAAFFNPEICNLLLNMGVGAEVVDAYGYPVDGHLVIITDTCDRIESTYMSIIAADQETDLVEFCEGYFYSFHSLSVEDFRSRVEKWVTEYNVNLFKPSPLEVVTQRLCNLSIDQIEFCKWKDIASYLIAKKARIYEAESRFDDITCLLEVALTSQAHPFDSQTIGTRFLEMLDTSNVDIAEYLTVERQHHLEGSLAPDIPMLTPQNSQALELYIYEGQPFSLSWDWWVDPEGKAFEVLNEFRYFGLGEHDLFGDYMFPERLNNWPFIYPGWMYCFEVLPYERLFHKAKAVMKRFHQCSDNRWRKKMIKQAKVQGTYRKSKIPGTWIN